jgi:hypothetical protein
MLTGVVSFLILTGVGSFLTLTRVVIGSFLTIDVFGESFVGVVDSFFIGTDLVPFIAAAFLA